MGRVQTSYCCWSMRRGQWAATIAYAMKELSDNPGVHAAIQTLVKSDY